MKKLEALEIIKNNEVPGYFPGLWGSRDGAESDDRNCQSIIDEATGHNEQEINKSDDEQANVIFIPPFNKKFLEALKMLMRAVYH